MLRRNRDSANIFYFDEIICEFSCTVQLKKENALLHIKRKKKDNVFVIESLRGAPQRARDNDIWTVLLPVFACISQ